MTDDITLRVTQYRMSDESIWTVMRFSDDLHYDEEAGEGYEKVYMVPRELTEAEWFPIALTGRLEGVASLLSDAQEASYLAGVKQDDPSISMVNGAKRSLFAIVRGVRQYDVNDHSRTTMSQTFGTVGLYYNFETFQEEVYDRTVVSIVKERDIPLLR